MLVDGSTKSEGLAPVVGAKKITPYISGFFEKPLKTIPIGWLAWKIWANFPMIPKPECFGDLEGESLTKPPLG